MTEEQEEMIKVLIADDDPIFTSLASSCLEGAGFAATVADDGVAAMAMLERSQFDVAIIDLDMPQIDGFRLIGLMRGMPRCRHIAIIVISASQDEADYREAVGLGADAFQAKPVDWKLLPGAIMHTLEARRRRSEAARSTGPRHLQLVPRNVA